MTKKEYVLLYEKCAAGNCTQEEKELLEQYEDDFSLDFTYSDLIKTDDEQEIAQRIYKKLRKSINEKQVNRLYWYKWSIAAAIALFVVSFSFYFYSDTPEKLIIQDQQVVSVVDLDSSKAVLTLADGSQLILDDSSNGVLANQGSSIIRKENDGKLVYDASAINPLVSYNSIVIPRGSEYQLVLPDGTKVWLNSESSLKFPVSFSGRERKVELTGEAYFEVAKNKEKPFRVMVKETEINVLGTHFNVNAYNAVQTTLIEGSVKLRNQAQEVLLKPGQSGIKNKNGGFKVEKADIEAITAWKNGYFVFHDKDIGSIMQEVARWYNVEIEYRGDVKSKAFYGKISRSDDISELLKNLELTGIVHFEIMPNDAFGKGRRVIVMP